ncbi:MAG: hypothetical protein NTY38_18285, partial [Acidobacteria bacterium]|nr:hypothetical protein [Acidobacteriota bacterium]
ELAKVQAQGYAIDDEESVLGVRCLAAPILNADHIAVAAISLSGPTSRITAGRLPEFAAALRAAAAKIRVLSASVAPRETLPNRALVQNRKADRPTRLSRMIHS